MLHMTIKKWIVLVVVLLCAEGFSQIGGQSVYQFLNLVTSPRQAALGGKVLTIVDSDVNQAHFNPAAINPEMDNHLAVNYGNYLGAVTYGTAWYAYSYDRHVQTFQVGVNYVNYGKIEGFDENGQATSSFTGSETALSFGYSYNVPRTDLYIGANAKLISSTLESYNSFGVAADFGALFIDTRNDVNWALVVRNLGTQITTYAGTGNATTLPTSRFAYSPGYDLIDNEPKYTFIDVYDKINDFRLNEIQNRVARKRQLI